MESAGFKIRVRCCTPLPSPPLYSLTPALQALEREAEKIQKEEARPAEANTHHNTCMCTRTIQITHPYHIYIYIYMLSRLHGPRAPTACSQQHRTSPRSRRFQCQSEVGYPSLSLSPSQSLGLLSLSLSGSLSRIILLSFSGYGLTVGCHGLSQREWGEGPGPGRGNE